MSLWENDEIQFARLLAEIAAIGLTENQMMDLEDSMDLPPAKIRELFDRAEARFEAAKDEFTRDRS
jgi:hypothetical protein